jgi:hypothetical protein
LALAESHLFASERNAASSAVSSKSMVVILTPRC